MLNVVEMVTFLPCLLCARPHFNAVTGEIPRSGTPQGLRPRELQGYPAAHIASVGGVLPEMPPQGFPSSSVGPCPPFAGAMLSFSHRQEVEGRPQSCTPPPESLCPQTFDSLIQGPSRLGQLGAL